MKKILLILLFLICKNTFAQDLIVTNNNDSVNCKILERKGSFIIYKIKIGDEYQTRSVKEEFVLKTEAQFYTLNPKLIKVHKDSSSTSSKNEFYLTFEINKSTLTEYINKTGDAKIDAINEELSSSISFSPIVEFWFNKKVGIGFKYEYYKKNAVDNNFPVYYGSFLVPFRLNEDVTIHTISPKINFRTSLIKDKSYLLFSAMFNYNFYNDLIELIDNSTYQNFSTEITGRKAGFGFSAGYEYHALENIKVGVIAGYSFCTLDEIYINVTQAQLSAANKINLNRINVGLFVGFH